MPLSRYSGPVAAVPSLADLFFSPLFSKFAPFSAMHTAEAAPEREKFSIEVP